MFLCQHKREEDEIVIQCDKGNTTLEVYNLLQDYQDDIKVTEAFLNKDFASFKNKLGEACSGDYIFQIDADEIPHKYLIENLPEILTSNDSEVILVPRVNTVEGLTQEHIQKWGWKVNKEGWVNWPDYQWRIYKNTPKIKWVNKVHERLDGFTKYGPLPTQEEFSLYHPKDIKRQEKQNEFYSKI
jgi:hypothetical protein